MIDKVLNELFAEILELSICVDGVWYMPVQEGFSTLITCAAVSGATFTLIFLVINFVFSSFVDLIGTLIRLWKSRKSPELQET